MSSVFIQFFFCWFSSKTLLLNRLLLLFAIELSAHLLLLWIALLSFVSNDSGNKNKDHAEKKPPQKHKKQNRKIKYQASNRHCVSACVWLNLNGARNHVISLSFAKQIQSPNQRQRQQQRTTYALFFTVFLASCIFLFCHSFTFHFNFFLLFFCIAGEIQKRRKKNQQRPKKSLFFRWKIANAIENDIRQRDKQTDTWILWRKCKNASQSNEREANEKAKLVRERRKEDEEMRMTMHLNATAERVTRKKGRPKKLK